MWFFGGLLLTPHTERSGASWPSICRAKMPSRHARRDDNPALFDRHAHIHLGLHGNLAQAEFAVLRGKLRCAGSGLRHVLGHV
jgi:hypothetical protein